MKSKTVAYLLWAFLGGCGVYWLYLKEPGKFVLRVLTANLFGILWIVDAFTLSDAVDEYNLRYSALHNSGSKNTNTNANNIVVNVPSAAPAAPAGGYYYAPPQPGYGAPQGGYYPPQGGYYPPQGGYYPPQGGYYPPQGGYNAPQNGYYGQPQQNGYYGSQTQQAPNNVNNARPAQNINNGQQQASNASKVSVNNAENQTSENKTEK